MFNQGSFFVFVFLKGEGFIKIFVQVHFIVIGADFNFLKFYQ